MPTRPSASRRGYGADWRKLRADQPKTPCIDCATPWSPSHHLDHVTPRARGGTDHPSNLTWRCRRCHSAKTATSDGGFGNPARPGAAPRPRLPVGADGWPVDPRRSG